MPRVAALLAAVSIASASNWTLLPNSRCHNDIGQVHNISTVESCESACIGTTGCALFTFCPPGGAPPDCVAGNGGPIPGTCCEYAWER